MNGIANLQAAVKGARPVIFVGAGASMEPPTNLPSWRDVNRIIVNALAAGAIPVVGEAEAHAEEAIGFSTTRKTLPTAPCAKRRRRDGDETRHLLRAAGALKDDPASVD